MADDIKKPANTKTPEDTDTGVILLSRADLAELVGSITDRVLKTNPATKVLPLEQQRQVANELKTSLASKVNDRLRRGNRFFAAMANSNARVPIVIDSIYRAHIGNFLPVTLNGSTVKIPVDGQVHMVHPAHAAIVREKLFYVSENIARNARSANNVFDNPDEVGDFAGTQTTK